MLRRIALLGISAATALTLSSRSSAQTGCMSLRGALTGVFESRLESVGIPPVGAGTEISATVSYEAGAAPESWDGVVVYELAFLDFTLEIGGVTSVPHPGRGGLATVGNAEAGAGEDVFQLCGATIFPPGEPHQTVLLSLSLEDESGTALDTDELPAALDPSRFSTLEFEGRTLPGDGRSFLFSARIDSVTPCEPEAVEFVRGDADMDGSIRLTDGVSVLRALFAGGSVDECQDASDSDDSGRLNLTDGVFIFLWLFADGPSPPPPSPSSADYPLTDCGTDPTDDGLGCASSGVCRS